MNNEKIKVLFIAGSGRSGTTILHNILEQIDGFCAIGELRELWERGLRKNRLCGCGVPFHECDFWDQTLTTAYGGRAAIDARFMARSTESFRIKDLPLTLFPGPRQKEVQRLQLYLQKLEKLYRALQLTAGSRVLVDSSKNPSYGYLLQCIPAIELYLLHYTRDSQAVAYSWSKVKEFQAGDRMARKSHLSSAMQWNARNLTAELFMRRHATRYLHLRYEDFIRRPQQTVQAILDLVDEQPPELPFVTPHSVQLDKANHSVFGNPVRFQKGEVQLRLDDTWQQKMNRRQKWTIRAITWPLRLKYGYR